MDTLRTLFRNEFGKIRYELWEWTIMRAVFGVFLWIGTSNRFYPIPVDIRDHTDQEKGNGLAGLFDLDWVGHSTTELVLQYFFLALLVVYVVGKWPLLVTSCLLIIHTLIGSISSSPAKDHHATQIIGMVLLGQFLWFAWEAVRGRFFEEKLRSPDCLDRPSGAIFFSQQLIAAAYTVSAISKWVNSGGGWFPGAKWISQIPNITVQFEKANMQAFYDKLHLPEGGALTRASLDVVIEHPVFALFVFGSAFYLEFFAILALWNRSIALIYGVALIVMHVGIDVMMQLRFFYFEAAVLIFFVNLPYWYTQIFRRTAVKGSQEG